ncbi:MAG: DUF4268 domain-containing protein [Lachnospiraceae bacterium]|nr:DUF4268 domain-containing protein [Lachnospiraceae bacterium]
MPEEDMTMKNDFENHATINKQQTGTDALQIQPTCCNYPSNDPLTAQGWVRDSLGYFRSSGRIKEKEGFQLYTRRRNLAEFIDAFSKKSSKGAREDARNNGLPVAGSSSPMAREKSSLTPIGEAEEESPSSQTENDTSRKLPVLSSFSDYPSLMAARTNKPSLCIGFDSEWQNLPYGRSMLSWQFAVVDGEDLLEFVFLKDVLWDNDLSFEDALGCILDHLDSYAPVDISSIRRYKYCAAWKDGAPVETITADLDEARTQAKYVYRRGYGFTNEEITSMPDASEDYSKRNWSWFINFLDYSLVKSIKVTIICHKGVVDLSSLIYREKYLLKYLTDVQGGLVSLHPVRFEAKSFRRENANNTCIYPLTLSVADTMCHAPAGKKKLKNLGTVLGVQKVDIPDEQKEHMKDLVDRDKPLFMEYASTDSVLTLLYSAALYGYNQEIPVTVTGATANVMKRTMMDYLSCSSTAEFNKKYRGLHKVGHGLAKSTDRPGFVENTSLEPISNDAHTVQYFASHAYHGGFNGCFEVGYFPENTFDYDLLNAYPTAMCLVPDIDWNNPIRSEISHRNITLADFTGIGVINPITPFIGYIRFKFPDNVKFPCIPINVDGVPVYPRSSEGMDGVYTAGIFIWLALQLGAEVYCDCGYFLNVRYTDGYSQESHSLAAAVKQLVVDRNHAKNTCGIGSLEELILKMMVSSGYGKTSQNVIQKNTWSAYKDMMESLGCSSITNPVSAMMITSIVQCELLAALNQIHELGYKSYSVTTDGFITNCPEDVLKKLDLYGLRRFMEAARLYLTDGENPEIWEKKHVQDDLVNFTTRGNISLHDEANAEEGYTAVNPMRWGEKPYPGVCAHNSARSGFAPGIYEDRLWLMKQVLSRTGTVDYTEDEWTSFKEYVQGKPYRVTPVTRHIRMDYDMKRKPIRGSFTTDKVSIDGQEYEIAHFDTEPFENIEEFRLYRNKKKLTEVLRTEADWDVFWMKLALNTSGAQPRDLEWAILNSCIMGYRSGRWDIPGLDGKTVEEKCKWINAHNTSGKQFKPSDWKNARRPERQANMLPVEMIEDKLDELMNADR